MTEPLKLAVAGIGRMGTVHALHVQELARESGESEFAALADTDVERARQLSDELGLQVPIFSSLEELSKARICDAVIIVTPTDNHREHAAAMIAAGHRVLL